MIAERERIQSFFECASCGKTVPEIARADDFVKDLCAECESEHREAMAEIFDKEIRWRREEDEIPS